MAGKNGDNSSFIDEIINGIKGTEEGAPNRTDPSQRNRLFSIYLKTLAEEMRIQVATAGEANAAEI